MIRIFTGIPRMIIFAVCAVVFFTKEARMKRKLGKDYEGPLDGWE